MGVRIPEANAAGLPQASAASATNEQVLKLPAGVSVSSAVARLRGQHGVAYAVPDYVAHAAGAWFPNDRGRTNVLRGWQRTQWNFLSGAGVNAPAGWANLFAVHRGGAQGVTIAVLDTGVAYRNWKSFVRSPDFGRTRFVAPHDFVANNGYPLDRDGHGTLVAGLIAESTNNGYGLTGLAYAASIMPVRVLGSDGSGDAPTIARGIRYAVDHGAQIINLSLEFSVNPPTQASDIPDVISALRYAHQKGVMVVAAAGNDQADQIAYPARAPAVVSVGATTKDKCLAYYSNDGSRLDLVAPGGDSDAALDQSSCHPGRTLPDITQMTLLDSSNLHRFGYPGGWFGTSMSSPEVAAAAAMVIASGVVGRHPSPVQILTRLEATAQPLGGSKPNATYGYGLIDLGAATAPISHAPRR
jgi:serine protease